MVSRAEKDRRASAGGRTVLTGRVLPALSQPASSLQDHPEIEGEQAVLDRPSSTGRSPRSQAAASNVSETVHETTLSDAQTIALIEQYRRSPPEGSVLMRISPGVAKHILEHYPASNRPLKPMAIKGYAEDILADNWAITGESFKFSDAGLLIDGQNRLSAIIKAGRSLVSDVRFGVAEASFSKMDRGKSRSAEDVLSIAGFTDTRTLSSAVRWVALYDSDRVKSRGTFNPDEVLNFVQKTYPDLPEMISKARAVYKTTTQPRGVVTALLFMARRKNAEKAALFAEAFEMGNYGGPFSPLKFAIKRLEQIRTQSQGRVHDLVRFAILIKAWNAYVEGKKGSLSMMNWTLEEQFPKVIG